MDLAGAVVATVDAGPLLPDAELPVGPVGAIDRVDRVEAGACGRWSPPSEEHDASATVTTAAVMIRTSRGGRGDGRLTRRKVSDGRLTRAGTGA